MDSTADYDVLIAGGGPVGGALALALRESGLKLAVLETKASDATRGDPRPLALSYGTRLILERLGVWQLLGPTKPIARIHVSQRGGFGRVALAASALQLPALGYVLDYTRLAATVAGMLQGGWCDYLTATTMSGHRIAAGSALVDLDMSGQGRRSTARLVVIADGGTQSGMDEMRTVDYGQVALTARVASPAKSEDIAYERFTPEGPLALLPSADGFALVWTTTPQRAQQLCAAPEAEFLFELKRAFGERLGDFTGAEQRAAFPLALRIARKITAPRTVRIGNAAQTLHPVAGQGLNLGLRDAWELATELRRHRPGDIGAEELLRAYAARRRLDRAGGIWFTHNLVRIFSTELAPLKLARTFGLAALAAVPPAQDFLARRMTFGARG
ncbi:MAG TPA: FAD-dependent monooxygenase [Burkholderiales bacterium]|nr:FAD-dependent monooxygenase [Burkholderiales bacterium]